MKTLKAVMSALLVPFDEDGSLKEKGLEQIIEHNIKQGIEGLYVGGSTGENFLIDTAMKKRIFSLTAQIVNRRIPLVAQVGSLNIYEALDLAAHAEGLGYAAISSVTPFYYQFSFKEISQYYRDLGKAVDLPMIVYFIPALTGKNYTKNQLSDLISPENVLGIKFTSDNLFQLERLRQTFPEKTIFNGYDEICASGLMAGADGAIGSTFNVTAPLVLGIRDAVGRGDNLRARTLQHHLNTYIEDAVANGLYPTLKYHLTLAGADGGLCRRPTLPLDEQQKAEALRIYNELLSLEA